MRNFLYWVAVYAILIALAALGLFALMQYSTKEDCSKFDYVASKGICGTTAP